jgi:hypothetical protein
VDDTLNTKFNVDSDDEGVTEGGKEAKKLKQTKTSTRHVESTTPHAVFVVVVVVCFLPLLRFFLYTSIIITGSTWCRPATLNSGVQRIVLTWCQ